MCAYQINFIRISYLIESFDWKKQRQTYHSPITLIDLDVKEEAKQRKRFPSTLDGEISIDCGVSQSILMLYVLEDY